MTKASIELTGDVFSNPGMLGPNQLASQVAQSYLQWNSGRQVWLERIREISQYLYATSTQETTNRTAPWSHSTRIPKLTQIYDNLGANYAMSMFANREFFTFDPAEPDSATAAKAKAIISYLTTKHDSASFFKIMRELLDDWVRTGNCFCRVDYVCEQIEDPKTKELTTIYEGPKLTRISPYDIVFDHSASEFKNAPKIVRQLLTRGEFFRQIEEVAGRDDYDPIEVERVKKFYSVLAGMSDVDINKYIQIQFDGFQGSSSFFRSGKVEVLEFMGDIYEPATGTLHKDCLITVVDRRFLLRSKKMSDYQGTGMIYHCGWRKRPDNLWAQGPLDQLVGMQYLLDHLENARADSFDQMLSPDRVHKGNVEIEQEGPVTNYYIDDASGDVHNLAPDPTVLQADMQMKYKEAQMEAYAGAPQEAMGIRSPGEKTAFEVNALQNAASRLFMHKIMQFSEEFVEEIINGELEVSVRNLNMSDVAKVIDKDYGVTQFMQITKDDITAKGRLKARGAEHFARRAQLVQELGGLETQLKMDPKLAMHFPAQVRAETWAKALGYDGPSISLYQAFGQIAEDLQAHKMMIAAQSIADKHQAAANVADPHSPTGMVPPPGGPGQPPPTGGAVTPPTGPSRFARNA
jgi:hypothetical protein